MAKFFYGDVARDHDNFYKKHVFADTPLYVKVKSHPGDKTDLMHKFRINKSVNDKNEASYSVINAATMRHTYDIFSSKFKLSNCCAHFEVTGKPEGLNKDGMKFEHKHTATYTPSNNGFETTQAFKFAAPEMGPAKVWTTCDFTYKNSGDKTIKPTMNIQASDDFHIGFKGEHDTKVLKSAEGQLAKTDKDIFMFLKGNMKKEVTLGGFWKQCDCLTHYAQFTYDLEKKTDGCCGQPITAQIGHGFKVNDSIKGKCMGFVGKDIVLKTSLEQKVDDKLTIIGSDTVNASAWWKDPSQAAYSFGIELDYHL